MNRALRSAGAWGLGFALVAVSAAAGVFYLAVALHAWLSTLVGPGLAACAVGAVLLTPALGALIWHILARRAAQRDAVLRAELVHDAGEHAPLTGVVLGALGALLRAKPVTTLALAAAAAAVAIRHPRAAAALTRRLLH